MLDDAVEDRLYVEAGRAHRIEDVGHGGLAFEGGVELVEEVGVRDGERRLFGERGQGLELGVVERPDLMAIHVQAADGRSLERQPCGRVAADTPNAGQLMEVGPLGAHPLHVFELRHATRPDGEEFARDSHVGADRRADVRRHGGPVRSDVPGGVALGHRDRTCLAAAELGCVLEDAFQHRRQIARVFADQRQHLARGGLELKRLLEVVEEPCVADRDRRLVGERLQDRCLLLVERADLGAAQIDLANPLAVDAKRELRRAPDVVLPEPFGESRGCAVVLCPTVVVKPRLVGEDLMASVRKVRANRRHCTADRRLEANEITVSELHRS